MLSSAPSTLLLSTALAPIDAAAGIPGPAAGGETAPGFAELLKGLSALVGAPSGSAAMPGQASPGATENELPAPAPETLAAMASLPTLTADFVKAAIASGKVLPLALPLAAETAAAPASAEKVAAEEIGVTQADVSAPAVVDPLLALLDLTLVPALSAAPSGKPAAAGPSLAGAASPAPPPAPQSALAPASPNLLGPALATASTPASAPGLPPAVVVTVSPPLASAAVHSHLPLNAALKAQPADVQATELRTAAAAASSVVTRPDAASLAATPTLEPAVTGQPKPPRATEQLRVETPALSSPVSASSIAGAPSAGPSLVPMVPVTHAAAPSPTPVDINAALDRLVAAREALLPAATALSVDHAEFGEVTIRFEQSTNGRISAELAAKDPDLQRAVNAAVAAERGASSGAESDGGRSTGTANPRGSSSGGEAAPGERGQRSNDRDTNARRNADRSRAEPTTTDPHSGVFA